MLSRFKKSKHPPEAPSDPAADARDIAEHKDIAALGYLWVLSVLIYFLKRKSPFVRFHAKQGMILFLLSLPLWIVPIIGNILELFIFAAMVIGFLNAAQGLRHDIPIVGPLSRGEISVRDAWKQVVESVVRFARAFMKAAKYSPPPKPPAEKPSSPPPPHPPAAAPDNPKV